MRYIVDYDELYSIEDALEKKIFDWLPALDNTGKNAKALMDTDSFQGELATNYRTYLTEVHTRILGFIIETLDALMIKYTMYREGYSQIDSGLHTHIREEDLGSIQSHFHQIGYGVDGVDEKLVRALKSVRDLIYLSAPDPEGLIQKLDDVCSHCMNLDDAISDYENMHRSRDFVDLDAAISNLRTWIDNQLGEKRVSIGDYQPGMWTQMTDCIALLTSMQSLANYHKETEDEYKAALEHAAQRIEDIQEERQWVKWVAAGVCIVGSLALIAVTLGGATPLVCAGVGAAAGLTSAAVNGFADNYIENGSLVDGMNWAEFGKDCLIGTVTGAIAGYGGAVAYGSTVVNPMEKAMMEMATGMAKNGTEELINFTYDFGAAIVADGATFDSVMSVAEDSTGSMMKNVLVGMAGDAAGGYIGGLNEAKNAGKSFWNTIGEKTIENLAENEAKIGAGATYDAFMGVTGGKGGIEILSAIDEDMKNGLLDAAEGEVSAAISGGFDTAIDNKFGNNQTTGGKVTKDTIKSVNQTAFDSAGKFAKGIAEQYLDGEEIDPGKVWKEDLGGGTEVFKSAGEAIGGNVFDEIYSDRKFENRLKQHDYDRDGKLDVVTFNNFSGYSVLKEDYDAAIEMAGKKGYEGKRAQDILGIPRNVSLSDENIEVHRYNVSSMKKSDYSGKGNTNAMKLEHV